MTAHELLTQLAGRAGPSPLEAMRGVVTPSSEIEDFRPLAESLEWRLADAYWAGAGALPFVRNDVPHLVNNSGRLSGNAAALVFAAWKEQAAMPDRLIIFELGAGVGLCARYFLDAFRALCRNERRDFYDRLTYVVTDRFERTVDGWGRDGVFADHQEHVAPRLCDARTPAVLRTVDGQPAPWPGAPLVVIGNYVLDVLPSTIARRTPAGLEQLCVRTHLGDPSPATLRAAGLGSLDDVRALAASGATADLVRLLPLHGALALETAYRPWTPPDPATQALAASIAEGQRAIVNGGAVACLDQLLPLLADDGFVLINDYGPVRAHDVPDHAALQRFGGSVALGLNFPLLEQHLGTRGFTVTAPPGDEQRRVHTRLVARRPRAALLATLSERFSLETDRALDAPQEDARGHLAAGRASEAVAAYRQMVERNPDDWQMLGEAAEYIGLQLRDHAAGLQLARAALERNPWYSSWLWNVLGDCLFYREDLAGAHAAFEQALRIDPDDPRSNLNLAYTLSARGDQPAALAAVARGLAHDGRGVYRPRLLEKQAQILSLISERAAADQERLVRRAERFR